MCVSRGRCYQLLWRKKFVVLISRIKDFIIILLLFRQCWIDLCCVIKKGIRDSQPLVDNNIAESQFYIVSLKCSTKVPKVLFKDYTPLLPDTFSGNRNNPIAPSHFLNFLCSAPNWILWIPWWPKPYFHSSNWIAAKTRVTKCQADQKRTYFYRGFFQHLLCLKKQKRWRGCLWKSRLIPKKSSWQIQQYLLLAFIANTPL